MDTENHRRYFLYGDDRSIGPIAFSDLVDGLQGEKLGRDAFVWREGLREWESPDGVPELAPYAVYLPSETAWPHFESMLRKTIPSPLSHFETQFASPRPVVQTAWVEDAPVASSQTTNPVDKPKINLLLAGSFLLLATSALIWWMLPVEDPIFKKMDETSRVRLKTVSRRSLKMPVQVASAVLSDGPELERIVIAANVPDGTRFQILMMGIPDTLVGSWQARAESEVEVQNGIGVIAPLKFSGGRTIAGRYRAELRCLNCLRGKLEFKLTDTIPIGLTPESKYQTELASFHVLVRDQATSELNELSEMTSVIEERLNRGRRRDSAMHQQIDALLGTINEKSTASYFYLDIYLSLKNLSAQFTSLSSSQMKADLLAIRSKIEEAKLSLGRTKGFPQRDQGKEI